MTAFFYLFFIADFFFCLKRSGFVVGARENGLGARPNFLYAGKTLTTHTHTSICNTHHTHTRQYTTHTPRNTHVNLPHTQPPSFCHILYAFFYIMLPYKSGYHKW